MSCIENRCLICGRRYISEAMHCKQCQTQLDELIKEGLIPRGITLYHYEEVVVKMRQMRKEGKPESEVKAAMQERFDQLHRLWLHDREPRKLNIPSAEEIRKELPF